MSLLRGEADRDRAAAAVAETHGWTLTGASDAHEQIDGWPVTVGRDRRSHRTLTGSHRGGEVLTFDLTYRLTDRLVERLLLPRQKWTIAALTNPYAVSLPPLLVAPQGPLGRLATRAVDLDIELESDEFNQTFLVGSPDRRFASDFLTPEVMELLLRWPELAWRTVGDRLVAFRQGWGAVGDVVLVLDLAADIMAEVPEFVWAGREGSS